MNTILHFLISDDDRSKENGEDMFSLSERIRLPKLLFYYTLWAWQDSGRSHQILIKGLIWNDGMALNKDACIKERFCMYCVQFLF